MLPDTERNSTSTIKSASENWACLCFWNPYLGCSPWIIQAQVSDPFKHSLCLLKSSPFCFAFRRMYNFSYQVERKTWRTRHIFKVCLIDVGCCDSFPLMEISACSKDSQPANRLVTQCTDMTRKFMKTYQRGCSRDEGNNKNARLGGTAERRPVSLKRQNLAPSEKLKSGLCIFTAPWWIRTFDF